MRNATAVLLLLLGEAHRLGVDLAAPRSAQSSKSPAKVAITWPDEDQHQANDAADASPEPPIKPTPAERNVSA